MIVNENSSARLLVNMYDRHHKPIVPVSAKFKVCNYRDGKELKPWTEVGVQETLILDIPGDINYYELDEDACVASRAVTVEIEDVAGLTKTEEFYYKIRNLKGYK